jgi:hypothetical protein
VMLSPPLEAERLCHYYFVFVVSIFEIKHLSNTNSADNNSNSSYESDETQSTNSDSIRPCLPHSSHIVTRHLIIIMDVLVVEQVIDVKNHYLKRQEVYHLIVLYQFINIYSVHREIKLVLRLYQDKWQNFMWKELKEKSIKLLDNKMRFEDEKGYDADQIISSQKNVNTIEETTDTFPSSTTSESKKLGSETPPSQIASINAIYPSSSPTTTLAAPSTAVVLHYYPAPQHHNVMFSRHILPAATSTGLYLIQPNHYSPVMEVRYPAGGLHHYPQYPPPAALVHHHPPPRLHSILSHQHISTNGYNISGFHPHPNESFTSTSTFIAHQTDSQ